MSEIKLTETFIDDLVNGLKHMADDHECCRETIELTVQTLQELWQACGDDVNVKKKSGK